MALLEWCLAVSPGGLQLRVLQIENWIFAFSHFWLSCAILLHVQKLLKTGIFLEPETYTPVNKQSNTFISVALDITIQ